LWSGKRSVWYPLSIERSISAMGDLAVSSTRANYSLVVTADEIGDKVMQNNSMLSQIDVRIVEPNISRFQSQTLHIHA
jgi:S-ribosylhomocysteine lyase LuxS involved in autoinducer biosynthesis